MLDPLKFQVAIQDNATQQLEEIERKLKSLQDTQTVNIKVEGADQLKQIFETLNRGTANNAASDVKVSIEEMISAIAASRKAIKNNSFDDFAISIGNAYQSLTKLTEQLSKFGTAISQDSNLKNFVSGLGAVIQDVQNTMGSLKGRELGLTRDEGDVYAKNVEKVADAINRLEQLRQRAMTAMSKGGSSGDMWQWLDAIEKYQKRLGDILHNPDIMSGKLGADVFGANFKDLFRVVGEMEKMANQYAKAQEAMQKAVNMSSASAAQSNVSLFSSQNTEEIRKQIDAVGALYMRIKELSNLTHSRPQFNKQLSLEWDTSKIPEKDLLDVYSQTFSKLRAELKQLKESGYDVSGFEQQLNALLATYEKFSALQPVDLGRKLGIEHLKGYTGPTTAADDVTWAAMKHQAEVQEVAGEAAKRHQRKLEELTNAFAQYDAQVAKSQRVQENDNHSRQQSVQTLRRQAEELVKVRMEMLRSQSADLGKLLSKGKGILGVEQYGAVRDALRAVRTEMGQLETMMQRMGSYSTRELFNAGRGTTMDYSPLIANVKQTAKVKEEAAASTSKLTEQERQLAQAIRGVNDEGRNQSSILGDLKSLAMQYLGVWGAQQFLHNIIEIGGQLEMQRLSIGAILGDMAKADTLFGQIKDLAIKSPFGVVELDQMTKQLSAYGFEYNELFDMTKRLADISAATGTEVSRLALALGHVRSEGALSGYTLRQFSMANIPLAKKLSERLSEVEGKLVSIAEVRKRVRKKEIGYEDVLSVMKDITDEGGMFYNAQEVMSGSVKAKFKNMKDAMDIMYGELAESAIGDALKQVATVLTELTKRWEEVGAVMAVVAGYFAVQKVSMLALSNATMQSNVMAGRFTAKQLEMQATTGALSKNLLLQAVATKRVSVADAEAAGAVMGLSRAQLQHAANTGKVTASLNMATLATSKYTVAQLRSMVAARQTGGLIGSIKIALYGIGGAAKSAGRAIKSMMSSLLPLLGISLIVELFMHMRKEAEDTAEAVNEVGRSARQMMMDINKAVETATSGGKPVDATSLHESINAMRTVLEESGMYTKEMQTQVDTASSLSQKYDILLRQLKEMREEAEWLANSEELIAKLLGSTSKEWQTDPVPTLVSSFGLNEGLEENMKDVTKAEGALKTSISLLAEYQGVMQEAIEKNNNFGLSLDGKTWQEQIRMLAESDQWDKFVASVQNAGGRFADQAEKVKDASDDVKDKWDEVVNDDLQKIMFTFAEYLGTNEEGVRKWAKTNERMVKFMADGIAKALNLSAENIEKFMKFFYELFGLKYNGTAKSTTPTQYDVQNQMGRRVVTNVVRKYGNGITSVKEINELVGTTNEPKDAKEAIKAIVDWAKGAHEDMVSVGKMYGKTSNEYKKAEKEYERRKKVAKANGIDESEIISGKKNGSRSGESEQSKALRERVRVLKEVADAYQYWRGKVGDAGAFAHVQDEFGDLLDKLGLNSQNVGDLRGNLEKELGNLGLITDKKIRTETAKEIHKELALLDRKDFEKKTEDFLSRTQIELENLTRAWDEFNQVLNATGNIDLARNISGAAYISGVIETAADAVRQKVKNDYRNAGGKTGGLSFNAFLSDKEIEEEVRNGAPRGEGESLAQYEERIKSLTEEYKKWRDLQRQQHTTDLQKYANILGGMVDYQSQLNKLEEEYKQTLAAINRLEELTPDEKKKAIDAATAKKDSGVWHLTASYSNLYNNAMGLSSTAFYDAFKKEMADLDKLFKTGALKVNDYNKKVAELNKIEREFSQRGFLGIHGGVGAFLSGGVSGLSSYYRSREQEARRRGEEGVDEANKWKKRADTLDDQQEAAEDAAMALQELGNAANVLAKMFDALGMEGTANAFSDTGAVLGGIASGAKSLSAFGSWGMAAGAVIGGITSISETHDKKRERQIEALRQDVQKIDDTLNNIKSLRERTLGYDNKEFRKMLYQAYSLQKTTEERVLQNGLKYTADTTRPAVKGMIEFYGRGKDYETGYEQELANMEQKREKYMQMYDKEKGKKKTSQKALDEYKAKIAELDEEIMFFTESLANQLWEIDFKGWADQISDAIWTAFENGEDAAKAFGDTAESIVASVAKKMWNLGAIEPLFERLRKSLFGEYDVSIGRYYGGALKYNTAGGIDMEGSEGDVLRVLGEFFGKNGIISEAVTNGEKFFAWVQDITGMNFGKNGSSMTGGIKGITEQTADLLASYLNATRADVSLIRQMQTTYFEEFKRSLLDGNQELRTISQNTRAIMVSNDKIAEYTESVDNLMRGLKNGVWRIPVE